MGTINTSSREYKEGITPLDPQRAMEAVRNTEAVTFDYVAPTRTAEWYDLPDDPEQAEQVLAQRLTAAPWRRRRHQHGFIAEDCTSCSSSAKARPHRGAASASSSPVCRTSTTASRPSKGVEHGPHPRPAPGRIPVDKALLDAKIGANAQTLKKSTVALADLFDWPAAYTAEQLVELYGYTLEEANLFKSAWAIPTVTAAVDGLQMVE